MKEAKRCKLIILGQSAVGKTSLFHQFVHENDLQRPVPTIGIEYKQKLVELADGSLVKVQVWDTAGTERFRTVSPVYYRNVDGVLLVFDITDATSFQNIQYWIDELKDKGEDQAELILVGNKNDLHQHRQVEKRLAQKKATELGIKYCQTNSFDFEVARQPFDSLMYNFLKKKKSEQLKDTKETRFTNSGSIRLSDSSKIDKSTKKNDDCC